MKKDRKTGLMWYSPTDLMNFMDSQFYSWMNRFRAEFPEHPISLMRDKDDEMDLTLQKEGMVHEASYFDKVRSDEKVRTFEVPDKGTNDEKYQLTRKLMEEGYDVIFQARLEKENFGGFADILYKRKGPSKLGDFYYEPWDTKLSRSVRAKYAIQLCAYAEMLEVIQGEVPQLQGGIILGNLAEIPLALTDYKYYYQALKRSFLEQQTNFNPAEVPDPARYANHGMWSNYAQKVLEERDHLSLVARITKNQIKILESHGITTVNDLANCKEKHIPKMNDEILERLIDQASLQVKSRGKERPLFRVLHPTPQHPRTGLALLPPKNKHDVYFDMEGYPLVEGGLEYLFGACYYDKKGKLEFMDFWAHDEEQEKKAFEDFIDWVYALWKAEPQSHCYHYASYERTAINKLMLRYGTREKEVDELYTHGYFIDLYEIVRNGLRVGEPAYSIKNIEHLYLEKRESEVTNAASSVVFYNKWIQLQDGKDYNESPTLKAIRDYNIDDCVSTEGLALFLRKVQEEAGIKWAGKVLLTDDEEEQRSRFTAAADLRDAMLEKFQGDEAMETLAWLVEWQRREFKPKAWARYTRLAMTTTELYEDPDCLAQVKITSQGEPHGKVWEYTGSFDPAQETKFEEEDGFIFQENPNERKTIYSILDINYDEGTVVLTGPGSLPDSINLIPDDFIPPEPLRTAIYEAVESVCDDRPISKALLDFLYHKRPDLKGSKKGPVIDTSKDLLEEVSRVALEMQDTSLVIQGPPGAGKTFTSAMTILRLLSEGKEVGITSNSHKAVTNLVHKVLELNKKERLKLHWVGGDGPDFPSDPRIVLCQSGSKAKPRDLEECNLFCGTSWAMSNRNMRGRLDYLFIDEASQMCLAYMTAMSRSTRNFILMGDQMQLQQPSQGVHPGLSGQSILEYYLQGKATIPEDLGVFLPFTWRMHPLVNDVVSEMVYEGRLKPAEHTKNRKILLDNGRAAHVNVEAGIIFVPVEHTGNSQLSQEEIEVIKEIVEEMKGRTLTDDKGNPCGKVTDESFLITAPYNLQVNCLKKSLPDFKIGTVDKFQGQEAPVSILSLCTSTFEDSSSSRGVGFLFSKNRLNVALSRAKSISIVVGSPDLINTPVKTLEQMKLVNFFCRIVCGK